MDELLQYRLSVQNCSMGIFIIFFHLPNWLVFACFPFHLPDFSDNLFLPIYVIMYSLSLFCMLVLSRESS